MQTTYIILLDITDNIRQIRLAKGITQSELARRIDIERGNYSRIENKGDKLTIEQASKIAQALEVSLIELLTWGDEKEVPEPIMDENQKLKDDLIQLQREKIKYYETAISKIAINLAFNEFYMGKDQEGNYYVEFVEDPKTNELGYTFPTSKWRRFLTEYIRHSAFITLLRSYGLISSKEVIESSIDLMSLELNIPPNEALRVSKLRKNNDLIPRYEFEDDEGTITSG